MHHYLYYKPNIILSKTDKFTVFNVNVTLSTKHPESDVISYCDTFGTTYFSENYFKAMFSFHWISVLLLSVIFYTYLSNIVFFRATWPLSQSSTSNSWELLQHTFSS